MDAGRRRILTGVALVVLIGFILVIVLPRSDEATEPAAPTTPVKSTEEKEETTVDTQYAGTVAAPEFAPGLDWINVDAPLTIEALRGKVVVLDFWTYGCINCIHMIPTLERLEEKYPDDLVIIGVHSAKFANEGETDNIRQIVQRYDLHHPVINDKDFIVWQAFGVRAWPTFTLIDPAGNVLAQQGGEIPFEAFDSLIGGMVAYFDEQGLINRELIQLDLEGATDPGQPLKFPGKVLADPEGGRLFIADSNHHRIIIADLDSAEVLDVIGTGRRGFDDGDFESASFNKPQGMALRGEMLYLADTNNHAIRAVNLSERTVSTIAGTGVMGTSRVAFGTTIPAALRYDLRSPWDVEFGEGSLLYIAMAGTHQIWALDVDGGGLIASVVGSGREALTNGSLADSALAQPSGLYFRFNRLYFADSESSSIRVADFNSQQVSTIAGTAEDNLFDFGDVDGVGGTSRLQHALGVTGDDNGLIYVADTYNSKIKVYDPATGEIKTLLGLGGEGGFHDGGLTDAQFDEPGGLDYANGRLYVADTNNNAIRVIDLATDTVSTVMFPNPEKLQIADQTTVVGGNSALGETITLPAQTAAPGDGTIMIVLTLPEHYKINDLIDSVVTLSSENGAVDIPADHAVTIIDGKSVSIPVMLSEGRDSLHADLTLYYCREGEESLCFIDSVLIEAPVTVSATGGESTIVIERQIVPPEGV